MTDDTTDDDATHRAITTDDEEQPTVREMFASLLGHDEPASAATPDRIGADSVRTDEWHIPYDDQIEVYLSHDDTEYRVVERDGELALEATEDNK
ncbi:hypothetical protein PM023_16095 [Halorubrum ezzemoulense]|uniref:hypothetical protein n=1 Tax=Halorubrum ezzemoulense TaxID=337243 RepID=UPI00232CF9EF|nr:hypothetical protein [Halorubrum ezzemoulense]MDB2226168.1 hypothetical protein [Halorubrum ezzemoulense]